jgi:hypothetical protein
VIVAVRPVRVVQMVTHQEIRVIAMRNGLVATIRPVAMVNRVGIAIVLGCAPSRVFVGNVDLVLVDVSIMLVVQMALVHVIHVPCMHHRRMSATITVLVCVGDVSRMCHMTSMVKLFAVRANIAVSSFGLTTTLPAVQRSPDSASQLTKCTRSVRMAVSESLNHCRTNC